MNNRLQTAKSIDEVIQYHDIFLEKCLRECMLLLPVLLKKMEKLKLICIRYAAATQWLISSSIEVADPQSGSGKGSKFRTSTKALKFTENAAVTDSVLKFEKEFNAELQSLGPILSSRSQAEPYLTHLAQWILGVGNEQ
ncbi:Gamma-tubulin complex component 2 [Bienertia sinuspersici]